MTKTMRVTGALQWRIFLGLALTIIAVSCNTQSEPTEGETSIESEPPITTQTLEPVSTDQDAQRNVPSEQENTAFDQAPGQNRYQSDRFGFSFTYPDDYELTVFHADTSTEEYLSLIRPEDSGDPEPPFIGLSVYENSQQLSIEGFREARGYFIINEYPNMTVAGQRALDFDAGGLYEERHHLFKTPNGSHIVSFSSAYLDTISETDPLWKTAQEIRDTFEWRLAVDDVPQSPTVPEKPVTVAHVEPFTLDELFEQGAGGCGMSLLQPNAAPGEGFLFSHGIDNTPALIKMGGQWIRLARTESNGEEFYGQYTSQTFVSEDGTVTVQVDVSLGEVGEIESVEFADVQFKVMQNNQVVDVEAIGEAGC